MAALVADYGSDSSDSEDSTAENDSKISETNAKNKEVTLISADVILEQVVHGKCSSVFANPFLEAEKCHNDSLEQHVKMTNLKLLEQNYSKNICYKFQKGKCLFGDKCKYYHPQNILSQSDPVAVDLTTPTLPTKTLRDENEDDVDRPKKKRYGLKNTLEPPKGYTKMYNKQKNMFVTK